jgi:mono/diheme cytochrome c family protein
MRRTLMALTIAMVMFNSRIGLGKKGLKKGDLGSELRRAPISAQSLRNPYAGQNDALGAGKKLYLRHCADCHGADGRGREKAPSLYSSIIQSATPGTLFWFLRNGNLSEGMPAWSRLPDQQLWQIVTFLQTLRPQLPNQNPIPPIRQ